MLTIKELDLEPVINKWFTEICISFADDVLNNRTEEAEPNRIFAENVENYIYWNDDILDIGKENILSIIQCLAQYDPHRLKTMKPMELLTNCVVYTLLAVFTKYRDGEEDPVKIAEYILNDTKPVVN